MSTMYVSAVLRLTDIWINALLAKLSEASNCLKYCSSCFMALFFSLRINIISIYLFMHLFYFHIYFHIYHFLKCYLVL